MDYAKELEELMLTVFREKGSDLHIAAGRKPAMRVTGSRVSLERHEAIPKEGIFEMLRILLGDSRLAIFNEEHEIDFSYDFQGKMRLRGNAFIQKGMPSIALRVIPGVRTLQELGLPPELKNFAMKEQGFFLVVGPVGQGKSTTLAALVEVINTERSEHIVTIEDPIEYIFEPKRSLIDQREIGTDTKDFDSALKSVFRQDANVLMIGEMRNPKTIATAVTAAETGHLVLSTVHTNNASQTIDRIVDSFPAEQQGQIRSQLAGSLIGIFSQRLIPKIGGGLVPAYELLINTTAVSNLIRENRTKEIDVLIETGTEQGMIDINRSLLSLVKNGDITMEHAYAHAINPKALERLL